MHRVADRIGFGARRAGPPAPFITAPAAERLRWGAGGGLLVGAGIALAALLVSDLRSAGFGDAVVPTPWGRVELTDALVAALLCFPLGTAIASLLAPRLASRAAAGYTSETGGEMDVSVLTRGRSALLGVIAVLPALAFGLWQYGAIPSGWAIAQLAVLLAVAGISAAPLAAQGNPPTQARAPIAPRVRTRTPTQDIHGDH